MPDPLSWSRPSHASSSSSSSPSGSTKPVTKKSKPNSGKKKVAKACLACQRSHLTCDERRPCVRCEKRGLGNECVEGVRKKAKYLLEGEERGGSMPVGSPSPSLTVHAQPAMNQPIEPRVNDDVWLSAPLDTNAVDEGGVDTEPLRFWSIPVVNDNVELPDLYPFGTTAASSEYQMLDSMFGSMSPVYPSFVEPQLPQLDTLISPAWPTQSAQAPHQAEVRGYDVPHNPWNGWAEFPKQEIEDEPLVPAAPVLRRRLTPNEVYRTVTKPYDYTEGYHFLMDYLSKHFEQRDVLRVVRALASFRPSLIALQMPMSEEDEIFLERSFQRTLIELEKLISYSATPTAVWRRTGEVCYANPEFCALVGRDEQTLFGKKTFVYQLFTRPSVVSYWESFSVHAFENTTQNFFLPTTLHVDGSDMVCSCCFTIRRDVFDLPSVVIGQFLPVPSDAN